MQKRYGFTLIELLVVIAIIAILAAILFPVFMKAKQAGQKASCMNGIKQLSAAFRLYADDNNDSVPPNYSPANKPTYPNGDPIMPNGAFLWMHYIYQYVRSVKAYNCPAGLGTFKGGYYWVGDKYDPELVALFPGYDPRYLNASYGFNRWLGRYIGGLDPDRKDIKYSLIPHTTTTPALADCSYYLTGPQTYVAGDGWRNDFPPAARHGDMTVMTFVDGHAEAVNRKNWITNTAHPDVSTPKSSIAPIWRKWDPLL